MCDYSQGGLPTRRAEVGDKLMISSYTHGFATVADDKVVGINGNRIRLTCLKEKGTVLKFTVGAHVVPALSQGLTVGKTYTGKYVNTGSAQFRDALTVNGSPVLIVYLPKGTTAEVMSIPSVTAAANKKAKAAKARKAKKQSLEVRLGLDKLNAKITTAKDTAKVRAIYRRRKTKAGARA